LFDLLIGEKPELIVERIRADVFILGESAEALLTTQSIACVDHTNLSYRKDVGYGPPKTSKASCSLASLGIVAGSLV
jgi:hypothetical protein